MAVNLFQRRLIHKAIQHWTHRFQSVLVKLQVDATLSNAGDVNLRNNNVILLQKRFVSAATKQLVYNLSGFRKYGLMRDDCLDEEKEEVAEALRRLDPDIRDARTYRILRATQLSLQYDILPKEEWTKLECDELYLTPLVKEVLKEIEEREEWNKLY